MTSQEFDLGKPWRLDDLPPSEREAIDEEYELEPDKWYVDLDGIVEEVPICPYCGKGTWAETRCPHVVFEYLASDIGDHGYNDIDELFKEYLINRWSPKQNDDDPDEELMEILEELEEGKFPYPEVLTEYIDGLEYRDVWYYWGAGHTVGQGTGYGYANDNFLSEIYKKMKLSVLKK